MKQLFTAALISVFFVSPIFAEEAGMASKIMSANESLSETKAMIVDKVEQVKEVVGEENVETIKAVATDKLEGAKEAMMQTGSGASEQADSLQNTAQDSLANITEDALETESETKEEAKEWWNFWD